jgi:nucleoside recognition membrane protein YjiH
MFCIFCRDVVSANKYSFKKYNYRLLEFDNPCNSHEKLVWSTNIMLYWLYVLSNSISNNTCRFNVIYM